MRTIRTIAVLLMAVMLAGCSRHRFEDFFRSGEQYLDAHSYTEAVIQFTNAARANPLSIGAQMKLGDAYKGLNQMANAVAAYQRACAIDDQGRACVQSAEAVPRLRG